MFVSFLRVTFSIPLLKIFCPIISIERLYFKNDISNQDLQFIVFNRTRNSEINSVKEAQRDAEQSVHANGQENMYRTLQENENENANHKRRAEL